MRVNYLGLEAFLAVAELGSFRKAAERLHLSQTALSHRLRKIEEELGVRLLARTSREVSLTEQGQAVLPRVKAQMSELNAILAELQEGARLSRQRVTFACLPTVVVNTLPHIMADFVAEYPAVDLFLRDLPVTEVIEQVRSGAVEFGITLLGATHWDLQGELLIAEPYHLLMARSHRLARRSSVTMDDLRGEDLVRIRTQSTNRELVEVALDPVMADLRWRYEVLNAATALAMVSTGRALTVLPRQMGLLGWADVVGRPFSDVTLVRKVGLLTRRGVPLSRPAQRLVDLLRQRLTQA